MIYVVAWIDSKCRKKKLKWPWDWPWVILYFLVPWMSPICILPWPRCLWNAPMHQTTWFHSVSRSRPLHHLPGDHHWLHPATVKSGFALIIWTCNKYSSTYTKYPCFIQKYLFHPFARPKIAHWLALFTLKEPLVCSHPKGSLLSPQHDLPRPRCWEHKNMKFCSTAWQQRFIAEITSWLITGFWNSSFWIKKNTLSLWWKVGYFLCPLRGLTLYLRNWMYSQVARRRVQSNGDAGDSYVNGTKDKHLVASSCLSSCLWNSLSNSVHKYAEKLTKRHPS